MDQDLRELERLWLADPAQRLPYERARIRAGFVPGDTTGIHREVEALREPLEAAGEAFVRATEQAVDLAVAAGFHDVRALDAVEVRSHLRPQRDREWTVDFQVHAHSRRPADLALDGLERLESRLLACAPIFGTTWGDEQTYRLWRTRDHVAIERRGPRDERAPIRRSAVRAVTLREVADFERSRARLSRRYPETVRIQPTDTAAAFARLDEMAAALDAAWKAFLDAMDSSWFRFVHALFAERPELERFVLHGYTPDYDDERYAEHAQTVLLVRDARRFDEVPAETRALLETLPVREWSWEEVEPIEDLLAPFEEALRRRLGYSWVLACERTPGGVALRTAPGWKPY